MARRKLSEEERRKRQCEFSRAYRQTHPEKVKAYRIKYYATHPEAAAKAAAFLKERQRLREYWRTWREEKILHKMEKRGYFV